MRISDADWLHDVELLEPEVVVEEERMLAARVRRVEEEDLASSRRHTIFEPERIMVPKAERARNRAPLAKVLLHGVVAAFHFDVSVRVVEVHRPVLGIFELSLPRLIYRAHHERHAAVRISVKGAVPLLAARNKPIVDIPVGAVHAYTWIHWVLALAELRELAGDGRQILAERPKADREGSIFALQAEQQLEEGGDELHLGTIRQHQI
mmetsp:Transcript_45262/g.145079  ORF Transcript_45262/g.145079 Transcript_45262/m.145079 type:complete len:208 (-) Transcript_45262:618-1241(-)